MFGLLVVLLAVGSLVAAAYRLGQTKREADQQRYNLLVVSMVVAGACAISGLFSSITGFNPLSTLGQKFYVPTAAVVSRH